MKSSERIKKATVVDFMRDAGFFIERGVRLLHRNEQEKALRCFRRAVDLEPANPEYLCHLASALAEMGQFQASNDVLYQIIDEIDPTMVDVYFYMANNYANLEDYQMAEEMAIRYLQESGHGVYAEEAEELLDYIYFELDLPPRRFIAESPDSVYGKHELARKSLEEGRFLEALEILKEIVQNDPSFMPAWNNLSLAYYYVGDFEKAMQTIEQTLEREPGNLHALCNLAVLLSHHNHTAELVTLIAKLKKVTPFHHEHIYKLATTMGVLGQHEEAFRLYQRMIRIYHPQEAYTYHYAAISAYLTNRTEQAIRWWQKVKQLDPETGIADHYLQLVKERENGENHEALPYHYHLPESQVKPEKGSWTCVDDFKADPMIRASLLWALQHGKDDVKHTVIQTLSMIGDDEAEAAIRQFCKQTSNQHLQKLALLALAEMGAPLPYEICETTDGPNCSDPVSKIIVKSFCDEGQAQLREWSLEIWQYYKESQPKPLQVRKEVAWAAALEYLYGVISNSKQSQSHVAKKFGVSLSTMAKCIKELTMLDLKKF